MIKSNNFLEQLTIAFELEIECNDPNIKTIVHEDDLINDIKFKLKSLLKNENIDYSEKIFFIEELINCVDFDDDIETLDNLLNYDNYEDKLENIIVYYASMIYEDTYNQMEMDESDLTTDERTKYLKDKVELHLPNFYKKHINDLDFVLDVTLDKGIEIKQKTYINGFNNSILFLDDFFNDFNNQTYWKFTKKTGLHINIGVNDINVNWNIVKGMFLLNDYQKDTPYVYENMKWRKDTNYTDSIFNQIELDKSKINLHDVNNTEKYIEEEILKTMRKFGSKKFAFNISKIQNHNYVEFRYVGGVVNQDLIINKMVYFCNIVKYMTNSKLQRKKYMKSLYQFVN
jgi:hypothetical protein